MSTAAAFLAATLVFGPPAAGEPPWSTPGPAPWAAAKLPAASVPRAYWRQWRKAANRAGCALIAPARLGDGAGAKPRAATFLGGWAVAYDLPGRRSAFGIAGAGIDADGPAYAGWPFVRAWADGGTAHYGLEGGVGPAHLAYLRIPGQGCLYNVWSALGQAHLETLLEQLRFVELPVANAPAPPPSLPRAAETPARRRAAP